MQYNPVYNYNDPDAYAQAYGQYGYDPASYAPAPSGQPSLEQDANAAVNQRQQAAAVPEPRPTPVPAKQAPMAADPESTKEVVKEEPKRVFSRPFNAALLCGAILIIIGAVVVLTVGFGIMGSGWATETNDGANEFTLSGSSGTSSELGGGVVIYRPPHGGQMTAPPAPAMNANDEDDEFTTTEAGITEKKMDPAPLVCMMGSKTNSTRMFPRDELCDYIFYDSLFKGGFAEFEPRNVDSGLRIFIDERPKFGKTEFGIGLASKYVHNLKETLQANPTSTSPMMSYFWQSNICHFGILDTPTWDFKESSIIAALKSLKILNEISHERRNEDHTCFMVFAALIKDDDWEGFYVDVFSTVFTPHLFISLGHYDRGDNTLPDCRVMPPTVLRKPEQLPISSSYQHDLTIAAGRLGRLAARNVKSAWALSVTMKGRWTVPQANERRDFLTPCVHDLTAESFASIAEVCNDPKYGRNYNYSEELQAAQFQSATDKRLLSFDNEVAFSQKVCTIKADHVSIGFGIAVFDLDYEDFSNACASTKLGQPFPRLETLKFLLAFIKASFRDPSYMYHCLQLLE